MTELTIALKLILSLVLGSVIGLERELNEKRTSRPGQKPTAILGLRSFALTTLLGSIAGFLFTDFQGLSLLLTGISLLLFIVFYVIDSLTTKDTGLTTEIALIFSFIIGVLIAVDLFPMHITIALAVILILLLSRKRKIKDVVEDIHHSELNAFIGYAIIALVILPFLPNVTYSISDFPGLENVLTSFGLDIEKIADLELFNPFKFWTIVVLITGIELVGYILERTIGQKKGWILASVAGGFVSSTATTQSLAQQSKESKRVNHLLAAALVANLVSFIQIAILLSPVNITFVAKLIPTLISIICAALITMVYFLRIKEKSSVAKKVAGEESARRESIFEIWPALKFAAIYLLVSIVSKLALVYFGEAAFLVTTAIGALAGLDAVMINTAQLAGSKISYALAFWAFIIANAVNLSGKVFYSFLQGSKEFALKFAISVVIMITASLVGILFI